MFSKNFHKEVCERIKPKYHLFAHEEKPGITKHENTTFMNVMKGTKYPVKDSSGNITYLEPPIEFELPMKEW